MKNCKFCGAAIDESVVFCPMCGANQTADATAADNNAAGGTVVNATQKHTGFVVLGFFFPIVALILYLVWKDKEPAKALACGKGGLMSVSLSYPLVALAVYLIMKDQYPEIAKACGICGIISVVISVVFTFLWFVLFLMFGFAGAAGAVDPSFTIMM